MTFPLLPGILCVIFNIFEEISVDYMRRTLKASPLDRAQLDQWLWINPRVSMVTFSFFFLARIARWLFFVYCGWKITWWYPLLVFGICLTAGALAVAIARLLFGHRWPCLAAFLVMPITGIWMWIAVGR